MALLVDLQIVPDKIFEAVKARILRNRARWLERQRVAQVRGPSRPRVQRTRFNASATTYRRPEPAATPSGQGLELGHFWLFHENDSHTPTSMMIRFGLLNQPPIEGYSGLITRSDTKFKRDILIGSGTGSTWLTAKHAEVSESYVTSDDYSPVFEGVIQWHYPFLSNERLGSRTWISLGQRTVGSLPTQTNTSTYFAIPAGRGNFILVVLSKRSWWMLVTKAYYANYQGWQYPGDGYGGIYNGYACPRHTTQIQHCGPDYMYDYPYDALLIQTGPNTSEPILTIPNSGYVSHEYRTEGEREIALYVGNAQSLRKLSTVPSALKSVIDVMFPKPQKTLNRQSTFRGQVLTGTVYQNGANLWGTPTANGRAGFQDNNWGSVFTPQVFEVLNGYFQFVSQSQIKSYSAVKPQLQEGLTDRSEGSAYRIFQQYEDSPQTVPYPYWSSVYGQGLPFLHALWKQKNQEADLDIYDAGATGPRPMPVSKATLTLAADRPARVGPNPSDDGPYYQVEAFGTVWDWDDPGYCMTMCKALGFAESDLSP